MNIRHFIGAYGTVQILLALLAAFGVTAIYSFHETFCHQMAERSFHIGDAQLSLCARCVGVYFGLAIAAMIQAHLTPLLKRNLVLVMAISFIIFGVEKILFEPNGIEAGNILRFLVGIGLGYCLAIVVFFLWDPKEANPFIINPVKTTQLKTAKAKR